jgi:hypothetical protein
MINPTPLKDRSDNAQVCGRVGPQINNDTTEGLSRESSRNAARKNEDSTDKGATE